MKKCITRAIVVTLIGMMGLMTSCYGPFALTSKIHSWNGQVSNSKFVNELVFLGLCILPVYELCTLGDALIFNSIEFWGGANPIAMQEGQIDESEIMHNGQKYKMTKTKNNMTIALADDSAKAEFRYSAEEKAWYQVNGDEKVQVVKLNGNKVFTYLPNNKTLVFDKNTANQIEAEVMAAR